MREHVVRQVLCGEAEISPLLQRIAVEVVNMVPAAEGATVLLHEDGVMRVVATHGIADSAVGQQYPSATLAVSAAFASGVPLCSDDFGADERFSGGVDFRPAPDRRDRSRGLVVVPLRHGEALIGALAVASPQAGAFDGEAVSGVVRISDFVATTLVASREAGTAACSVLDSLGEPIDVPAADGARHVCRSDAAQVGSFLTEVLRPGAVEAALARGRVAEALADGALHCVVQPLIDLRDGRLLAAEALARFTGLPRRGPDVWFAEAHATGLGLELETLAVSRALGLFDALPSLPALAINVSHDMLLGGDLPRLLDSHPTGRITIELTEHIVIEDYRSVRHALDEVRSLGVTLAIDDVGSGFSSFRHIAELEPTQIKLDRLFVENVGRGRVWWAMAEALVELAAQTGAVLVAEGIETEAQLRLTRELGVAVGQGYLIARPAPPEEMPLSFAHLPALSAGGRSAAA